MKRNVTCGLTILLVFSGSAFSYDGCQAPVDADLPPCLSLTNSALTEVYDELMNVIQTPLLDEQEKLDLRKDEVQWLKLRDKQCEIKSNTKFHSFYEWSHSIEPDKTKSRCVVDKTNQRTTYLEQIKKKKEDSIKQIDSEADASKNESKIPIIPNDGQDVLAFIPRGYAIFEKIEKDFNGDNLKDVATILRPVMPNEFGARPFLILMARRGGGFFLSARNDYLAPNGDSGGIANPYGADALKYRGQQIIIEDRGGAGTVQQGGSIGFGFMNNAWYLVSKGEWETNTNEYSDLCINAGIPKLSMPWHCPKHEVHTDLVTGLVVESWLILNDDTNKERNKKITRHVEIKKLTLLNEYRNDAQ